MGCDWTKIKSEYITDSRSSYRKLAEKYNVPFATLQCRARRENWAEIKKRTQDKIITKTIDKEVDRLTRYLDVTDKILDKIEEAVDELSFADMLKKSTLRQISGALKDIKDIQGVKSTLDIKEQEARIRKLEQDAESTDDVPNEITINITGGDKSWAE